MAALALQSRATDVTVGKHLQCSLQTELLTPGTE